MRVKEIIDKINQIDDDIRKAHELQRDLEKAHVSGNKQAVEVVQSLIESSADLRDIYQHAVDEAEVYLAPLRDPHTGE